MSSPENVQMTNPPTKQTRMVKIKALHPIRVGSLENETIIQPGAVAEVTEEQAKEFCETKFDIGYKDTFGNRNPGELKRQHVVRAERVK